MQRFETKILKKFNMEVGVYFDSFKSVSFLKKCEDLKNTKASEQHIKGIFKSLVEG